MRLGLCIMVKDEERRIGGCLRDIIDLFDDVVILDTGSTDRTREIVRDQFDIQPVETRLNEKRCHCHSDVRNHGFQLLRTPWIMNLDADERISRNNLEKVLAQPDDPNIAGYFLQWNTYKEAQSVIEDYKLSVFRKGIRKCGLVHGNMQFCIRQLGLQARWLDGVVLNHYPEARKDAFKSGFYLDRLYCALEAEPHWHRYYWFLGYTFFRRGDYRMAEKYLKVAAHSHSEEFPVECLNSAMVLAEIYARSTRREQLQTLLQEALTFYVRVAGDFEIRINFRMKPWLERANEACQANSLDRIRVYDFAY
nr:glycosyltransferase [Gammaproteobacteria bacterium]